MRTVPYPLTERGIESLPTSRDPARKRSSTSSVETDAMQCIVTQCNVGQETIERELAKLMKRFPIQNANEIGRLCVMLAGHGVPDPAAATGDESSLFCCHDYDSENSYETSFPLTKARASS